MSNTQPLMDLLFPSARQRVLALLLLQPASAFHLRELARATGTHPGTLGRELDKLARAGLLLRSEQGNQRRYAANTTHPLFGDLAAMFRKTHGVVPVLRDALAPLAPGIRLALVFGSIASGTQSAGSDVDLLVLGHLGFAALAQALFPLHETLGREVNPVLYAPEDFAARVQRGDAFARGIMERPRLFVTGSEDELAELAGDRSPAAARA